MRIRVLTIIAGLAVDFIGSILFGASLIFIGGLFGHWLGPMLNGLSSATVLLAAYWIGLGFTLFGGYVTAMLSRPNCVLNTFLFGLLSTVPSFFYISQYPAWFTALCILTILPVSLATGYVVAAREV